MKPILHLLAFILSAMYPEASAMEPRSRIDIDGLKDQIPLSINGVTNGKMEYANWMENAESNKMYIQCHFEAADWKIGSLSFTPLKTGRLAVGLRGIFSKKGEPIPWFNFSELSISGANVSKGEFGDLPLWFIQPKATIIDAARTSGGKSLNVSHNAAAYRLINAVEGVQITIKFYHKFSDEREPTPEPVK